MGLMILLLYSLLIFYASTKTVSKRPDSSIHVLSQPAGRHCGGRSSAFFVNNRAGTALDVALSTIVSCIGASATIGTIGLAFKVGTPAFWWLGAGCMGLTLLSLFLAGKVRASGAYTLPELSEKILGRRARSLIAVVIVVAWLAILAAQFAAITGVLGALTGLSRPFCQVIGFALIVLHTLGGQAAIMRVDRFQAFILLAALGIFLLWLSGQNPGWATGTGIELVNQGFPAEKLVYFILIIGGNYLVCPMLFGRFFSAKNEREAKLGGLLAVGGLALGSALIVAIGLACQGLLPSETFGDQVLPKALSLAPGWMNILISIALVSAIVSSADSCLLTAGTVMANDLLNSDAPAVGRRCILILGLSGLLLSLAGKGILDYLLMAYDVYVCGVVAPVFIGLFFNRRQIKSGRACSAIVTGGLLGAASALSGIIYFSYAGLLAATIVCLTGLRPRVVDSSSQNKVYQAEQSS